MSQDIRFRSILQSRLSHLSSLLAALESSPSAIFSEEVCDYIAMLRDLKWQVELAIDFLSNPIDEPANLASRSAWQACTRY